MSIVRTAMMKLARLYFPNGIAPYKAEWDKIVEEGETEIEKARAADQARISKLETALRELTGFAERNSKRAEAAWRAVVYVDGKALPIAEWPPEEKQMSSRWHEANRFLSVVRDRVKEALAP